GLGIAFGGGKSFSAQWAWTRVARTLTSLVKSQECCGDTWIPFSRPGPTKKARGRVTPGPARIPRVRPGATTARGRGGANGAAGRTGAPRRSDRPAAGA